MNGKELYEIIGMIDENLIVEESKEAAVMKKSKIKIMAIAAAAIMVVGAATGVMGHYLLGSVSMQGSIFPTYTEIPDAVTLKNDVGFKTNLIEEFSNGYTFKDATVIESENFDTEGNSVEKYKSIGCDYEKDGDNIDLYADASMDGHGGVSSSELVGSFNGAEVYYYSYTNKLVPGDYELTEQDKADEAAGKYVFSYGNPEGISVCEVQGAVWRYEGINYSLCAIDSPLTKAELAEMAKEIIEAQ